MGLLADPHGPDELAERVAEDLPRALSYLDGQIRGADFLSPTQAAAGAPQRSKLWDYRTRAEHERAGTGYYFDAEQPIEQPGTSCFLRDGDRVFHTYSTFGRGAEMLGGSYTGSI